MCPKHSTTTVADKPVRGREGHALLTSLPLQSQTAPATAVSIAARERRWVRQHGVTWAPLSDQPSEAAFFFYTPLSSQRVAVSHASAGCRCKVLNAETTMQRKRGSGGDEPKYRKSREVLYSSCRRVPRTFSTDADAITNCTLPRWNKRGFGKTPLSLVFIAEAGYWRPRAAAV